MATQSVGLNDLTYTLIDSAITSRGSVQNLGGQTVRLVVATSIPTLTATNYFNLGKFHTEPYSLTGSDNLYGICENGITSVTFIKEP